MNISLYFKLYNDKNRNMKKNYLFTAIAISSYILFAISCNTKPDGDGSVTVIEKADGNKLTICHFKNVKDTVTYNLSDFVKDFKIVRFENSDEAIFKVGGTPIVTDKYIGIRQSQRPFFLFDHNGKLLCEVGGVGGGPGEYTSLYDEAINDKLEKVYLAPFAHSPKIMEYATDGNFVRDIPVKANLSKPKISVADNGDITIVHLPFSSEENPFIALQYDKDGKLKNEANPTSSLLVDFTDPSGNNVGFNNEIFSYRNTDNFDFMITSKDTLFHYNPKENKVFSQYTIDFGNMAEKPWCIHTEIPDYYLSYIHRNGIIIVDQKKMTSSYLKIVNDFFGHIDAPKFNFNKGWFYQIFEPSYLMEIIEKRLDHSDCSTEDRKQLEELMSSLNENDNNIMFIGKLKR